MRKVLGQMDTTAANNRENIQKKLEKLEKKLLESDRQFIKLYEDFTKQLVSEQQFRMLSTHFEQEKKETTEEIEKLDISQLGIATSEFVASQTGVLSVSTACSYLASGKGEILRDKAKYKGITIALSKEKS